MANKIPQQNRHKATITNLLSSAGKSKSRIILYGVSLALIAFFLQWLDYTYAIRTLSTEWYLVILALIFSVVGIWVGNQLTRTKSLETKPTINQSAIQALDISQKEYAVLVQLSDGLSNQQIADVLHVSVNTVKTHLAHLYQKLDVKRRGEAVKKAKSLHIVI